MAKKLYDLSVKTGEYKDSTGAVKGRWQNVGAVMQNDDGGKYIMLSKWFNPAGVPDLSGKNATSESILLSMFPPKDGQHQQTGGGGINKAPDYKTGGGGVPKSDMPDDDIPF